jgi:hypothetical protein
LVLVLAFFSGRLSTRGSSHGRQTAAGFSQKVGGRILAYGLKLKIQFVVFNSLAVGQLVGGSPPFSRWPSANGKPAVRPASF